MSDSSASGPAPDQAQLMSAMFASLVMQNTNMALIFLGHAPNPQTGQTSQDLENARYFIDQLEMLAVKTKGNLDRNEESILKQSLTNLRLAFVEAVSNPSTAAPAPSAAAPSSTPAGDAAQTTPTTDEQETPSAQPPPEGEPAGEAARIVPPEEESKKKFSKKY